MPKKATPASFKKGNQSAKGNDKTLRLSTWIEKMLDKELGDITTLEGYEATMQARQVLALKLVRKALTMRDDALFKSYFQEIADRTEGKPQQSVDVTTLGQKVTSMNLDDATARLGELD